jgi:hypothetical protein
MATNEISLGFPDAETVTVFMDGKHVATMTNAPGYEDGIPVELFDLMRAAPELLAACHSLLSMLDAINKANKAIDKAEGKVK